MYSKAKAGYINLCHAALKSTTEIELLRRIAKAHGYAALIQDLFGVDVFIDIALAAQETLPKGTVAVFGVPTQVIIKVKN